ncbi:MAG: hypothetical protein HYU68_12835 [Bacteroidetes bacterium]|nr:hypothetical protein [Bacteroidota bacterium]
MTDQTIQNWFCQLNPFEIVLGFAIGIATSFAYAYMSNEIERRKLNNEFKPLEGKYIRYWLEGKIISNGKIFVTCELFHLNEKRFDIKVTTLLEYGDKPSAGTPYLPESIEVWTGEVTMDSKRNGMIVWEQLQPVNGNNGFKRIIFSPNLQEITIVGEKDFGFKTERFTEKV